MNTKTEEKTVPIYKWAATLNKQLKYMYALTNRLSREQFNFKPESDRWSVGECIEHLNISMRAYLKLMQPVIENNNIKVSDSGRYAQGPIPGRLMLKALRKDGRRYPAPRSFIPAQKKLHPNRVRKSFDQEISRLRHLLEDCDGLALGKITMPWPVFRFIKISLAQAFELQILHNERHFKQAEQVIQHVDFPRRNGEFF